MDVKVFFIRHKLGLKTNEIKTLKSKKRIAIHFGNEFHQYLKDYKNPTPGFKKAFRVFKDISKNECLVVFEYDIPTVFYIAKIHKQLIEPLSLKIKKKEVILKTLKYIEAKSFKYSDYPILAAIRPPFSTVVRTRGTFSSIVKFLYLKIVPKITVNLLHPQMIEQMCENYLRSDFVEKNIRLNYTFLQTGKNMPFIDIAGKSKTGERVYAQITYNSDNRKVKNSVEKAITLVEFCNKKDISILFSKDKIKPNINGLKYHFSIEAIFNQFFNSDDVLHKEMIWDLIGFKINV